MYQFTTTTILNSQLDSNGSTAKYAGTAQGLNVTRVNFFKKAGIVSVYKKAYSAGVKEVASITIAASTSGLVNRLEVDVRLSQQTNSEYANTYLYFKKPVVVEVLSSGVAATDATALITQINGLKDRFGFSYITATSGGSGIITLTATDNNQRFFSIKQTEEVALTLNSNSIIQPEYTVKATGTVTTAGLVGFGDDDFMVRSIMFPTYENSRYFGTNKEERPIIGGNYSQYTLRYKIQKDSADGILAEGNSITTHVFYVPAANVTTFETAITNTGLSILASSPGAGAFQLTTNDNLIVVGDTTTITPVGALGAVTFASGTTATATVVAGTGVVTGVAAGTTVITATDATGATGTITITVIA